METYKFDDLLAKKMQDPAFRKEYEALGKEYALAEEVIKLRASKNMTQQELAEKAGTSQPAIARLESGRYKNISMSFLRKIGSALNAEPVVHFQSL
jgi:DNA-binding Xre family transcriptional regulator